MDMCLNGGHITLSDSRRIASRMGRL